VAFAGFGWRIGLVSLFLTVGSAILLRPLAARIGAKLLHFPGQSGIDVSHPPRALAAYPGIGRGQGIQSANDLLSSSERKRQGEEGLFDYCEQSLAVKQVMQEFLSFGYKVSHGLRAQIWREFPGMCQCLEYILELHPNSSEYSAI